MARGGSFMIEAAGTREVMCPERFTEEQWALFDAAMRFSREDVLPRAAAIERQEPGVLRGLLEKAGELGLLGIDLPEAHGGLALNKTTSLLVAEAKSILGSWSVTFGAQTCIGTLPIVYFGTPAQQAKYLPKLATGEWVSAYALTETGSGSDALGAKTTARKTADGKGWALNGSKQFITNAGFADVFIVFAKVDGAFTGFIVDRKTPGLTVGPEEKKLGLRGSSTCALTFEDAVIPSENLLGELGKGHKIAFNVLNLGRLKLGAGVLGAMKLQLASVLKYVTQRTQFSTPLLEFGLTREKLGRMVSNIYAVESMAYRTSGLIDEAVSKGSTSLAAIEEFAIEASMLKVFGSEAVGQLIDDALQLHGGYGYLEDFPVERAYRDVRINRIFEGTNEINRLLITGTLLKRMFKGLPLLEPRPEAVGDATWSEHLKAVARRCLSVAVEAHGMGLEKHQLVLASIADILTDAYAVDSMVARTAQLKSVEPWRRAALELFVNSAHARAQVCAQRALSGCLAPEALGPALQEVRGLQVVVLHDVEQTLETLAKAAEGAGGYPRLR